MESVLRAVVLYALLLVIFRLTGKRSLTQITVFDFVLLLIISEAAQNGLVGEDYSVTNALLVILTLVMMDVGLSLLKGKSKTLERLMDGLPLVLMENGRPIPERLAKSRVDEEDILSSARRTRGLERMEQIKYAVLEREGEISIVAADSARNGKTASHQTERPE